MATFWFQFTCTYISIETIHEYVILRIPQVFLSLPVYLMLVGLKTLLILLKILIED